MASRKSQVSRHSPRKRARLGRAAEHLIRAAEICAEEEPRKAPAILSAAADLFDRAGQAQSAAVVRERLTTLRRIIRTAARRHEL